MVATDPIVRRTTTLHGIKFFELALKHAAMPSFKSEDVLLALRELTLPGHDSSVTADLVAVIKALFAYEAFHPNRDDIAYLEAHIAQNARFLSDPVRQVFREEIEKLSVQ